MPHQISRISALVADPSAHMSALVAVMLRSVGFRRINAILDLPHTAIELAQTPYDLILIDDRLGGEAVNEMIRMVRRMAGHPNRETPVIMMAAAPDARMIATARDAGVTEFLRKPFSAEHVGQRLDALRRAPRNFIEAETFSGPDRRRRTAPAARHRRASDTRPG